MVIYLILKEPPAAMVLKAGEKGGDFARTAFWGLGVAFLYAILQKVLHFIAEVPIMPRNR